MGTPIPDVHIVDYWPPDLPEVRHGFVGAWRETVQAYDGEMIPAAVAIGRAKIARHSLADYIEQHRIGWIKFSNGRLLVRASDVEAIRRIRSTYGLSLFPARYKDLHAFAQQFGTHSNEDKGVAA